LNCLGCYEALPVPPPPGEYHPKCSRRLFGLSGPPRIEFGIGELDELAKSALSRHLGVTGVQPKITLAVRTRSPERISRLTIMGLWGSYILKPPTSRFPDMPVVEDLTMHMARAAGIETASHGLIRLASGELAYITRRFDRGRKGEKTAVEDFCQLSGLLTEQKYKTSMEKAGKLIADFSGRPGLDVLKFFDIALFSFLTGNADMHLKNFSLLRQPDGDYMLAPAYDLLATRLMPVEDPEEMALTVNGRKNRLTRADFEALGRALKINDKALQNSFMRIENALPAVRALIDRSFLPAALRARYESLLGERAVRTGLKPLI
jgi:serine/threonine-protein kinase HipA